MATFLLDYGYDNCTHVFEHGRCIKCFWDGSTTAYLKSIADSNKIDNTSTANKKNDEGIVLTTAVTDKQFDDGKALFQQYANSLTFDLSFQNFADELKTINLQYNQPTGALLLAYYNGNPVGCVAIRQLEDNVAELKRLFVLPGYRGYKLGSKLLQLAISTAKQLGYIAIRLDSATEQIQAQNLYRQFGFYEIPPYRFNPLQGTVYMELILN